MKVSGSAHIPSRRRRGWLGILFLSLGATVVMAVFLLSGPSARPYEFLNEARMDYDDELIGRSLVGGPFYSRSNEFISKKNYSEISQEAKVELINRGYKVVERRKGFMALLRQPTDGLITLTDRHEFVSILLSESRPPTFFDRARLWLKSFLPKAKVKA